MAKKATKTAVAPVVPNLFAKATNTKTNATSKQPGTLITLPTEFEVIDGKRQLTAESNRLNDAINRLIEAKDDEKAAKNKGDLAKSDLGPYVESHYTELVAKQGILPATPITIVNVDGRSVTYVVQDRSSSNGLNDEQITLLVGLVGEDQTNNIIHETVQYSFNPAVMSDIAGELPKNASADTLANMPKVAEIVAEIVSKALMNDNRLTDEQKANLIECTSKKCLRSGTIDRITDIVGNDVSRIRTFFKVIGSSFVRYFKS